jgi:hypothetical protein
MNIVPYRLAAGISFGSSEADAISALGPPHERVVDSLAKVELRYESKVFRFSRNDGGLVEATLSSEYFQITGCAISSKQPPEVAFVELGYAFAKLDSASFYALGFFVSPAFGLAFDPHHAPHLTVFARSELATWESFRDRGKKSDICAT